MTVYKDIPELPPNWSRPLTTGAMQAGVFMAAVLLGIVVAQVFQYYRSFPNDPLYVKILVGVAFVLDVILAALDQRFLWFYTIETPCDIEGIGHVDLSLGFAIPILGTIALIVQTLYCLRLWRIAQSLLVALVCWSLALARFALFLYITYFAVTATELLAIKSNVFQRAFFACLGTGIAADVAVCISMSIALLKRRTGFSQTNKVLDRVIMFTIGSGLFPMVVGIAEFITYTIMRDKFVWMACFFINSQTLLNALLVSLNQRNANRSSELKFADSSHRSTISAPRYTFDKVNPQASGIVMELSTVTRSDPIEDRYRDSPRGKRDDVKYDLHGPHHIGMEV